MIEIKGFHITSRGDMSAGIFPAHWEITGDFFFENENELNEFRSKLKEAWEFVADDHYVETFEERVAAIKAEYFVMNPNEELL